MMVILYLNSLFLHLGMLKARFFDKFKTLLISLINLAESCELFSTSCTGWKFRIEAQESCRVSDYPTLGQLFT